MKPLHIGLLVAGAAAAGYLAVKIAGPPPSPELPPIRAVSKTSVTQKAALNPAVPAQSQAPPQPAPAVAVTPAPAPIFSEPPHVDQAPKRKPFAQPASKPTAGIARVQVPPPVSYQPPAMRPEPVPEQPAPSMAEAPHSEPPHVDPEPTLPEPVRRPEPARSVALDAGIPITIRLSETLSTEHVNPGDTFQATLADPVIANGFIIAERGARVSGRVTDAHRAGRFNGVSSIELRLLDFTTADGQRIPVSTDPWLKRGDSMTRSSVEKIGGGAALGAAIGAIAGGGVGAVIGMGAGGGIGATAAAATGSKPVSIPSETVIRFRLSSRILITERRL